jgi:imidazolonepropionase-like amidohydrolase
LHGHLAVATPDDVPEVQGAHLAGTQADVTQQPQDGGVTDVGSLEPGKWADVVRLRGDCPGLANVHDPRQQVV